MNGDLKETIFLEASLFGLAIAIRPDLFEFHSGLPNSHALVHKHQISCSAHNSSLIRLVLLISIEPPVICTLNQYIQINWII